MPTPYDFHINLYRRTYIDKKFFQDGTRKCPHIQGFGPSLRTDDLLTHNTSCNEPYWWRDVLLFVWRRGAMGRSDIPIRVALWIVLFERVDAGHGDAFVAAQDEKQEPRIFALLNPLSVISVFAMLRLSS